MSVQTKCVYEHPLLDGGVCNRPVIEGSNLCIFHEPDPKKDAKLFSERFKNYVESQTAGTNVFAGFIFPEGLSTSIFFEIDDFFKQNNFFTNAKFHIFIHLIAPHEHLYRVPIDGFCHFIMCDFFKGVHITAKFNSHSNFSGSTFHDTTRFIQTKFTEPVNFFQAQFKEEVHFSDCNFVGSADFDGAQFLKRTSFSSSKFHKGVTFRTSGELTCFRSETSFDECQFGSKDVPARTVFSECRFDDNVSFKSARFVCPAIFFDTRFLSKVSFNAASFEHSTTFDGRNQGIFNGGVHFTDISPSSAARITFRGCDLSEALFSDTDVTAIHFENCFWPLHGSLIFKRRGIYESDNQPLRKKQLTYRQLKQNFTQTADYVLAGEFHIGEMELSRSEVDTYSRLPLEFYRWLSFYGERWLRPVSIIGIYLFIFVSIELLEGVTINDEPINYSLTIGNTSLSDFSKDVLKVFFHGIQVITLQRTDVKEAPIVLVAIGGVLGPAMLTLSLLALRRRLKR